MFKKYTELLSPTYVSFDTQICIFIYPTILSFFVSPYFGAPYFLICFLLLLIAYIIANIL